MLCPSDYSTSKHKFWIRFSIHLHQTAATALHLAVDDGEATLVDLFHEGRGSPAVAKRLQMTGHECECTIKHVVRLHHVFILLQEEAVLIESIWKVRIETQAVLEEAPCLVALALSLHLQSLVQ